MSESFDLPPEFWKSPEGRLAILWDERTALRHYVEDLDAKLDHVRSLLEHAVIDVDGEALLADLLDNPPDDS
jgi:hypothetical protein